MYFKNKCSYEIVFIVQKLEIQVCIFFLKRKDNTPNPETKR